MAVSEKENIINYIYERICEKNPNAVCENGRLVFKEYELSLTANIVDIKSNNGSYAVTLVFVIVHPYFDEELVEVCAGFGNDNLAALNMGTDSFASGVLMPILAALKCESSDTITADVAGEKHIFRMPCVRTTANTGEKFMGKDHDILELIMDDIPKYLGKKKAYWIKLFAGWSGDNLSCEARINGALMPELTKKMHENMKKPSNPTVYSTEKQFLLLIQNDETYQPCPYTKAQVKDWTYDAIERIKTIDSQEKCNSVLSSIMEDCPEKSLGREMVMFIPEIFCSAVLGLRDGDGLVSANIDTNENVALKKTQLRGYGYIDSAVYRYIKEMKPQRDDALQIMSISSRFGGVQKALDTGSKLEDLVFSDIIYLINNEYRYW